MSRTLGPLVPPNYVFVCFQKEPIILNNRLCVTLHFSDATLLTLHVCIPVPKLASVPKRVIPVPHLNYVQYNTKSWGRNALFLLPPKTTASSSTPRWSQALDQQRSLVGRVSCQRWGLSLCSASFSWRCGHGSMAAHPH